MGAFAEPGALMGQTGAVVVVLCPPENEDVWGRGYHETCSDRAASPASRKAGQIGRTSMMIAVRTAGARS